VHGEGELERPPERGRVAHSERVSDVQRHERASRNLFSAFTDDATMDITNTPVFATRPRWMSSGVLPAVMTSASVLAIILPEITTTYVYT
jgi:hypothetical protein